MLNGVMYCVSCLAYFRKTLKLRKGKTTDFAIKKKKAKKPSHSLPSFSNSEI